MELKEEIKEKGKNKEERIFLKPGKTNKEDRINFVKYWANFVKTHSDKEWSKQQNVVVDSQYPLLKD